MLKKLSCLIIGLSLTACVMEPTKPKASLSDTDRLSQKGSAILYRCKEGKEVRVVRTLKKMKTTKHSKSIQVSFNNVTEKLAPTISENGQKYTNIRWHWVEQAENSKLTTSVGVILAEQCIHQ